jgi:hypothetical protein
MPPRPRKLSADPELTRRINELIAYKKGGHNVELVADIIENALKMLRMSSTAAMCA